MRPIGKGYAQRIRVFREKAWKKYCKGVKLSRADFRVLEVKDPVKYAQIKKIVWNMADRMEEAYRRGEEVKLFGVEVLKSG